MSCRLIPFVLSALWCVVAATEAAAQVRGAAHTDTTDPLDTTGTPAPAATPGAADPRLPAAGVGVPSPRIVRPQHTFSIVARDPFTGDLGVAVQTHWFRVGTSVPWARAGVGVVATQSFTNRSFGPRGLDLMQSGSPPAEALAELIASDPGEAVRQVALLDVRGRVAAHTGSDCIAWAGHHVGDGYAVQANLMLNDRVVPAMVAAFEAADDLSLAERMLATLEAAEAAGGDIRGRQSAALIVVPARASDAPWDDVLVDLRVDDHHDPLVELRRLFDVDRAYAHMNAGDLALQQGDMAGALDEYGNARFLLPDQPEVGFWNAVTLAGNGHLDAALPLFAEVFVAEPRWIEVLQRLPASRLLEPALVERVFEALGVDEGLRANAGLRGRTLIVDLDDPVMDGYTLYLPRRYGATREPWPIILFLQGGSSEGGPVSRVNQWPLPGLAMGTEPLDDELDRLVRDTFLIASPHVQQRSYEAHEGLVRRIVADVVAEHGGDPTRVYVTGMSRGGNGSWGLASRMPDVFAAAAPIAGHALGVEEDGWDDLANVPLWVIHNQGDQVILHERSAEAVRRLSLDGEAFKVLDDHDVPPTAYLGQRRLFTSVPGGDHDAWNPTYRRPHLYRWLLSHRRE